MPNFMCYGIDYIYICYRDSTKDACHQAYRFLSLIMILGAFYLIEFIVVFILWNKWNQMETIINTAVFQLQKVWSCLYLCSQVEQISLDIASSAQSHKMHLICSEWCLSTPVSFATHSHNCQGALHLGLHGALLP